MRKQYIILFLILSSVLLHSSCTKHFENLNTNPYEYTEEELQAGYRLMGEPLLQAQLNLLIYNDPPAAQLQQNLNADIFGGYTMTPTPFEGNNNNSNYGLIFYWNNNPWNIGYSNVMKNCKFTEDKAASKFPDFYAWAQLLKVLGMHRISDIYGPIIYSRYGKPGADQRVDYDTQKEAYYHFFNDLDSAISILTRLVKNHAEERFHSFDLVYNGNYTKWIRFANTLRLRLAIRISGVDKEKAKQEGETALNHPFGLLRDKEDIFSVDISPVTHPLNIMCYTWADLRMSAPMESILTGYKDPRLPKYFVPVNGTDEYHGIRQGIKIIAKEQYSGFSPITRLGGKITFMTPAEAWFLKAEAALYGWSGAGDAELNYRNGVAASFQQYDLTNVDQYLLNSTYKANPYTDPRNFENDIATGNPHLSTITIRWEEWASTEKKLERIITQKWIAMFPEGQEAWSEFRRTGYPKLFPVVINNSGGAIPTEKFIRRLPFPQIEWITNPKAVELAKTYLKGPDTGGTALWWDMN